MSGEDTKGAAGGKAVDGGEPASPARARQVLAEQGHPLFALLDAARSGRVLQMLGSSDVQRASLYTGPEGDSLSEVAPYLVALPHGSELLGRLLEEGWGRSWGVFVTSALPFRDLRRHFRRFLLAEDELGRSLYFRFYDPRVLRVFLDTCPPEHRAEFFGTAVKRFFVESSDARLRVFDAHPSQVPAHASNLQGPA